MEIALSLRAEVQRQFRRRQAGGFFGREVEFDGNAVGILHEDLIESLRAGLLFDIFDVPGLQVRHRFGQAAGPKGDVVDRPAAARDIPTTDRRLSILAVAGGLGDVNDIGVAKVL